MAVTKIQPTGVNSEASFTFANITATGNVLTSNLSVSGNLALSGSEINLGPVANVKITGGTANYVLKTDGTGNLDWVAQSGGSTINVSESNGTGGNITNSISSISTLRFNKDTGIYVSDLGGGNALVSLGSTFKTWKITGQSDLVAVGEDTIQFIEGSGITITSSNTASPKNITFVANNVANANYAIDAGTAATVTTNAQPNITSVGTLTSLSVSGNVTAGNLKTDNLLYANGTAWSMGGGGGTPGGSNTEIQFNDGSSFGGSANFTFNKTTNVLTINGNVAAGNANLGNLATANFFSGSGNLLSNIQGANVSGQVTYAATANSVAGSNVSGEVTYAATANAVAGSNVSGQVGNALIAGTVYTNAQPNITSVGTLTSLSVTGNVTGGNISATGKVYASDFINGGTGIYLAAGPSGYINFFTSTGDRVTITDAGNISAVGNAIASYFIGNGSALSSLTGANVTGEVTYAATANAVAGGNVSGQVANALISGTVYTNAQPNITSVGTLTSLSVSGNALVNGNLIVDGTTTYVNTTNLLVQDPIIEQGGGANGAALTTNDGKDRGIVLHYYSGSTRDAFMGWDNSNAEFSFGSNVSMSGEVATFNTLGNIRSGNASLGNLATASFFSGSGNLLSNIQGSNVSGEVAFAATANSVAGGNVSGTVSSATTATTAGTVTTAAQPNITSVGTLTALTVGPNSSIVLSGTTGYVKANSLQGLDGSQALYLGYSSVAGAIGIVTDLTVGTGGTGNVSANGTISATANVVAGNVKTDNLLYANGTAWSLGGGSYGNSNVATFLASFGSNTLVTTGNITTGNLIFGSGVVTGTGNVTAGNIIFGSGVVTGTGTITAGNLAVGAGYLSATGNANVGNVFVASTGVVSTAGTITAGNLAFGAGFVSGTGLITAGNLSATANVIAGNVKTDNLLYANGTAWSLGGGSYGNSNVATYLAAFGSNNISTTGIVTSGTVRTDNLQYANGTAWSLGGGGGGSYANANVTAYLPTHTGNVSGNYFIGNGFFLTGLSGVSGATISNGTSNVNIAAASGNVTIGVGGTAAVTTFSTTGMVVGAGNLTVGTGTGGNLTGITYNTANAYLTTGQNLGTVSGTTTINIAAGTYIQATTGGTTTWSFANTPASGNAIGVVLELTNGGTAAQTWTNVRWPAGTAPTLTAAGVDVLVFITDDGGTNWRGLASMIDSK